MKSLHKFTSLALLMLFVSMFFVEDAFACSVKANYQLLLISKKQ